MNKIKIALATFSIFVAVTIVVISCNKKPINSADIKNTNTYIKPQGKEISFFPKDRTEAGKLALNFLKQTKYSPVKQTRDGATSTYPTEMAAWLFEAGANFLENDNEVHRIYSTSTIIELPRLANGEIHAEDLIAAFNTFISTIEANPNIIPKLINVTITEELASSMHIAVSVDYGNEQPAGNFTWPNSSTDNLTAANNLMNNFASTSANFYNYIPTSSNNQDEWTVCNGFGYFWYNVTTIVGNCSNGGIYYPETADLPDPWLWTALYSSTANAQTNSFLPADGINYHNKLLAKAAYYNSLAGTGQYPINSKCIFIELVPGYINFGNPSNGSTYCLPGTPLINGYVLGKGDLVMANIGCMPMPQ